MGQELQTGAIAAALQWRATSCRKCSSYLLVWKSVPLDPAEEWVQLVRGHETDTAATSTANHRHTSSIPYLKFLLLWISQTTGQLAQLCKKKKESGKLVVMFHPVCMVQQMSDCLQQNIFSCQKKKKHYDVFSMSLAMFYNTFYQVPSDISGNHNKNSSVQTGIIQERSIKILF